MSTLAVVTAVREAGGTIAVEGHDLRIAAPAPLPDDLLAELRQRKPELLRLLSKNETNRSLGPQPGPGASDQAWLDWYTERCAIREYEGGYPRPMAEALAYGEAVNRWHLLHGKRPDPAYCAGCDELISGAETLSLPDGGRVHIDDEWICLRSYGKQWRGEAVKALAKMGISPPELSPVPNSFHNESDHYNNEDPKSQINS